MDMATAAFLVSGVLALIRIYEFFQDRRARLKLLVSLTGSEQIGNTLTLLNSSKVPANIYYVSLVWIEPTFLSRYLRFFRKIVTQETFSDHDYLNITVPPHGQQEFNYSEQYHFDWGQSLKHDIYLKVWLTGWRFPKWFFVTGPSKSWR
jgi:hypothetical protein